MRKSEDVGKENRGMKNGELEKKLGGGRWRRQQIERKRGRQEGEGCVCVCVCVCECVCVCVCM